MVAEITGSPISPISPIVNVNVIGARAFASAYHVRQGDDVQSRCTKY